MSFSNLHEIKEAHDMIKEDLPVLIGARKVDADMDASEYPYSNPDQSILMER